MELEPRELEKGWVKRTLVNGVKLSKRAPGWWFVIYIGFPIISIYAPDYAFQCAMMGVALIMGTFLAFKCDHLGKCTVSNFAAVLIRSPQPVIILLVTIGCVFSFTAEFEGVREKDFVDAYFSYGASLFFLMISSLFASMYLILFWDIPYFVWKMIANRKKKGKDLDDAFESHDVAGGLSVFALHLCVDTDMKWHESLDLSRKGISKMKNGLMIMSLGPIFVVVCPFLLGVVLPWVYCIYRELFWQSGITQREKKTRESKSAIPQPI